MAETFAQLVKEQRGPLPGGRFRFTQDYCAQEVGIHVSTWRAWERGRYCPRVNEAIAFARAFELDEDQVWAVIEAQEKETAKQKGRRSGAMNAR